MTGKVVNPMLSSKSRGALWLVAALPMIVIPAMNDGSKGILAVSVIFLIFGILALRQK